MYFDLQFFHITFQFMFLDGTEAFMNGVRKTDEKSYATTPNKGRAVTSKAGYMNPLERGNLNSNVVPRVYKL